MNTITTIFGTELKTTFWRDFSIAEKYGKSGVLETYQRAFNEWCDDVDFMKEFVFVLNHKLWYWYKQKDEKMTELYDGLWRKADEACLNHFQRNQEEISEYIRFLD